MCIITGVFAVPALNTAGIAPHPQVCVKERVRSGWGGVWWLFHVVVWLGYPKLKNHLFFSKCVCTHCPILPLLASLIPTDLPSVQHHFNYPPIACADVPSVQHHFNYSPIACADVSSVQHHFNYSLTRTARPRERGVWLPNNKCTHLFRC